MSLFIRCEWVPETNASIELRVAEATGVFGVRILAKIAGAQWYRLGRSKAEALSRPVSIDDLRQVQAWRRVPLIPGSMIYSADLWNGRDHPEGVNLSIAINVPSTDLDTCVVSNLDANYLRASGISWRDVLIFAESLAQMLGGVARISSHELLDQAKDWKAVGAQEAAYAAFWGIDRSGKNPRYHELMKKRKFPPVSCVAAKSWEEVYFAEIDQFREILQLLGN